MKGNGRQWLRLVGVSLLAGLFTACAVLPPAAPPLASSAATDRPAASVLNPTQTFSLPAPTQLKTTVGPTLAFTPPVSSPTAELPSITPAPQTATQAVASAEVVDVWDAPVHEKDYWSRQTQLVIGERVLVLAEQGDWDQIVAVEQPSHKDPRGYPGWVRRDTLAPGWPGADQYAVVMAPTSPGRASPDSSSGVIQWLPLDARLPVIRVENTWVQAALPDGRQVWLRDSDVRLANTRDGASPLDRIYDTAQSLVGVPYQWGGTGPSGLDCAGFTFRLFHAYGITLPRDADDQANTGSLVSITDLRRGDLVFTSDKKDGPVTHVAIAWGGGQVIDADSPKGLTIHPLNSFLEVNNLVSVRRYLP